MERLGLAAKVAVITIVVIGLAVLSYSQPKMPESRLPVDPVDNTVKAVNYDDLIKQIATDQQTINDLQSRISNLESRVSALETAQNR